MKAFGFMSVLFKSESRQPENHSDSTAAPAVFLGSEASTRKPKLKGLRVQTNLKAGDGDRGCNKPGALVGNNHWRKVKGNKAHRRGRNPLLKTQVDLKQLALAK